MSSAFPRTEVGGVSISRLICGTNWFLGYSHTSAAKDKLIRHLHPTSDKIADVIEVFAKAGINVVMGPMQPILHDAIRDAEQRVGEKLHWVVTPGGQETVSLNEWKPLVDEAVAKGATFCFPHQSVTDPRIDRVNNCLAPSLIEMLEYVKQAGLVPGLSTHMPEAVTASDATDAPVETYIQPYNAAGFLCQVETDWLQRIYQNARKPVMTIKPLAAGRLLPPTGLAFVWSTLRPCDLVTIGTLSTYEAEEVIELSLALIEGRKADVQLQFTRSKRSLVYEPSL